MADGQPTSPTRFWSARIAAVVVSGAACGGGSDTTGSSFWIATRDASRVPATRPATETPATLGMTFEPNRELLPALPG